MKVSDDVWKEFFGVSNFEEVKLDLVWLNNKHFSFGAELEHNLKKTRETLKKDLQDQE